MSPSGAEKRGVVKIPVEDPVSSLSATAQKILIAARRLLMDSGYESVTLEKVAAEAGVNKASIRYNFGNKAGLVSALVDLMLYEAFGRDLAALSSTPQGDRARSLVEGGRRIIEAADNFRGFFDILPHALRDQDLRGRMAESYRWRGEQNVRLLGLEGSGPEGRPDVLRGLGRLLSAVVDGLSIQASLEPDQFDMDAPLEALEFLLQRALQDPAGMAKQNAVRL